MAETTATTGTSTGSTGAEPEEDSARTGAVQEESAARGDGTGAAGGPDEPEGDGAGTTEPAADPAAEEPPAAGPDQAEAPSDARPAAPSGSAPSDSAPTAALSGSPAQDPPTLAETTRGLEPTASHLPTVAARPADLADLVTGGPPGGAKEAHEPRPDSPGRRAPADAGQGHRGRDPAGPDPAAGHGDRETTAASQYGGPQFRAGLLRSPGGGSPDPPDSGGPGRRMDTVPVRATGSPAGHPGIGVPGPGVPASAVLSTAAPPVSAPPQTGIPTRPTPPRVGGRGAAIGAARVTEGLRPPRASAPRGPRRARLNLKRVDPWSVMKFSFAVSIVLFIVVIVAASVLYLALDTMGVFTSINETVTDLVASGSAEEAGDAFRITAQGVIGTAAVLGALNVLLFTSLATLGAFIYNVCADLVGGVEVTLAERD